jgi:hypothetical protein
MPLAGWLGRLAGRGGMRLALLLVAAAACGSQQQQAAGDGGVGPVLAAAGLGEYEAALLAQGVATTEALAAAPPETLKLVGLNMRQRKKLVHALRDSGAASASASEPLPPASEPPTPAVDDENWSTAASRFDWDDCSIDSVPAAELTLEEFEQRYRGRAPVRILNLTHHLGWPANERWRKAALLGAFGERTIIADTMYDKSVKLGFDPSSATTLRSYVQGFGNGTTLQQRPASKSTADKRAKGKKSKGGADAAAADDVQQYVFDGSFMDSHAPELLNDFGKVPAFAEVWKTPSFEPVQH